MFFGEFLFLSMRFVRNILGILLGVFIGGLVNMALLNGLMYLIPPPEGYILGNIDSLKEFIGTFEFKHFIPPFLAHALRTFVGAFVATKIVFDKTIVFPLIVGLFFFIGGITMVYELKETPLWFSIVDLCFAYFPMVLMGWKAAK